MRIRNDGTPLETRTLASPDPATDADDDDDDDDDEEEEEDANAEAEASRMMPLRNGSFEGTW